MPRKPSVAPVAVFPDPDPDLEAFLDDVVASRPDPRMSLAQVSAALAPLADTLRATVADIGLLHVARATPAQRTMLATLRAQLDRTRADLSTWVDAIDISFRQAAIETGADEIILADGVVTIEKPRGEWVVNVPMLKDELAQLRAHGLISDVESEALFKTVVTVSADNTKLNYIAKHRGGAVAEAVGRARVWKEGNPANAKVRFQRTVEPQPKEDTDVD